MFILKQTISIITVVSRWLNIILIFWIASLMRDQKLYHTFCVFYFFCNILEYFAHRHISSDNILNQTWEQIYLRFWAWKVAAPLGFLCDPSRFVDRKRDLWRLLPLELRSQASWWGSSQEARALQLVWKSTLGIQTVQTAHNLRGILFKYLTIFTYL